jgi:manganese/zinc/iron transport system permease protein
MFASPLSFFTDPILQAPTIGSMLMCLSAALIGVIVFLRKQSLLGESLSHAAYPGVIGGLLVATLFISEEDDALLSFFILAGAFVTALAGLWTIHLMEQKLKVRSDSALCFVLSAFFGIGLTLATRIQYTHAALYNQVQIYLYGQAATMTDTHILIYGVLSCIILALVYLLYKELQLITFDRTYAQSLGLRVRQIDALVFILVVGAVVIGIRSVGIVLMSAMLIAPAAAARQYTNRLSLMLLLAALFGLFSGFMGNYLSVETNELLAQRYPSARLILPTGPMIVLVASAICLLSLLLAPERGLLLRLGRILYFRYECLCENILKAMWQKGGEKEEISFQQIASLQTASTLYLRFILFRLVANGWVDQYGHDCFRLTKEGTLWAGQIVRLHRLWEVYLVDYIGLGAEKVHHNAEEMEHILTPELEEELTLLLKDPKQDPHAQPIPAKERL